MGCYHYLHFSLLFYIFIFYFILKDVILFHDIEDTYKSFDFFITSKIEKREIYTQLYNKIGVFHI